MKKIIYIIIIFILISIPIILHYLFKEETININNISFEYYDNVYIKDVINENIDNNDILDTKSLGNKKYTLKKDKKIYNINYSVVDTTKPIILGYYNRTIQKGEKINLIKGVLCGDNYDNNVKCEVIGEYNTNKEGIYNLKYRAIDSSNNIEEKNFTLTVKNEITNSNNSKKSKFKFENLIKEYKNNNTKLGIDVSTWQGDIDWKKVKEAGCEFAMIRMAYGYDSNGKIIYDNKFKSNIKNAHKYGIDVGIYFYSYAKTEEEAINQAKWIINELDGEQLELPIAFDWENWSKFNSYKISFTTLNLIADSFIKTIENNNYKAMLYGSANYLLKIWNTNNKNIWLAHYTNKTDYDKPYYIWQLSSRGKIDGINGDVDLDILYFEKND